jgi:hypothetical protein
MSQPFTRVDDEVLQGLVDQARRRLVFIGPGVRKTVAHSLVQAMDRLPKDALHLVFDVDAEVCRLGYADTDLAGLKLLQAAAADRCLTINHHPGIRLGLVIADDTTVIYSPTPLLIEAESHQAEKPNGIRLESAVPEQIADACAVGREGYAKLAVGLTPIDQKSVAVVAHNLEERPPKEFNVARIERVFNSMLHYVEFRIENYKLTSRSLVLKAELFGVRNAEVVRRLTNRYHLFSESDALTVEIPHIGPDAQPDDKKPKEKFGPLSIDRERNRLKKKFIIEAGNYGLLILRRDVVKFELEIEVLRAKIAAYKQAVQEQIKKRTDEIVRELLAALAGRLKAEPPEHWQSRFLGQQPTEQDIERLFGEEVESEVSRVKTDFDPEVFTAYKDVTYQTFKEDKFRDLMEQRFGAEAIQRVFSEHDAAPETPRRSKTEAGQPECK